MNQESIFEMTFSEKGTRLPTNQEITHCIALEDTDYRDWEIIDSSFTVRTKYVKYSFCILSDELCKSIILMCNELNLSNIAELCSGPGWLSFWLKRYGLNVAKIIDNGSWKGMSSFLVDVLEKDAIEFVIDHPGIDLFILSWPYMDDVACRIWDKMQAGQLLLYIGEENGGCTANEEFFAGVSGKRIKDKWGLEKSLLSFYGIHDRLILYRK